MVDSVQDYIAYWRNQALQKQQQNSPSLETNLEQMVKALEEEIELTEGMD